RASVSGGYDAPPISAVNGRRCMQRSFFVVCMVVLAGACHLCSVSPGESSQLEIKYRYLVVEVVGPAEWEKKHKFSIPWKGKDMELPVVFRVPRPAEKFAMGSPGEIFGQLQIGKERLPVTAKPETKFQVRNTGAIAFIEEKSAQKGTVTLSIATSVAMSPPEFRGNISPELKEDEVKSAGKRLE